MRLARVLCLASTFAAAALSPALTLQWLSKWNPTQPVTTSFQRIRKVSGGYLIGSRTGTDVTLVKTDFNGNILDTQIWDSPSAGQDECLGLEVDDAGNAYLLAGTRISGPVAQVHLVAFSGTTLGVLWEKTYNPTGSSFGSVTMAIRSSGSSIAYLATGSGSGASNRMNVVGVRIDGTQLFSTDIDNGDDNDALCSVAYPTAGVGVVIGGGTGDREAVYHVSEGGSVVWSVFGAAPNVSGNQIQAIRLDGSLLTGVGRFRSALANPYQTSAYVISSSTVTRYLYASGTDGTDLVNTGTNQYSVLSRQSTGYRILNFDRSTGIFTLKIDNVNHTFPTFLRRTTGNQGLINGGGLVQCYNLTTNTILSSGGLTQSAFNDAAAESFYFVAAGTNNATGKGLLAWASESIQGQTLIGLGGYGQRTPVESVDDASGSKYVLSQTFDAMGNVQSWVTKTTSAGTVAWIRQIVVAGEGRINARALAWSSTDGTVVAVGSTINGDIASAKLNAATGAVIWAKQAVVVTFANSVADAKVDTSTGYVWILVNASQVGTDREGLLRLNENGQLVSSGYWSPLLLFSAALELHQINSGLWAASILGAGATYEAAAVRFVNASGALINQYEFDTTASLPGGIFSAQAPDGDLLTAVPRSNGDLEIRRFETSAGSLWNRTVTSRDNTNIALAGAPDGSAYVASRRYSDSTFRLERLSSTGTVDWNNALAATVTSVRDLATDSNSWAYFLGTEGTAPRNMYLARYLTNGVRSAQQRIAGEPTEVSTRSGFGVWAMGHVTARNRSRQVSLARYSSP